MKQEKEEKGQMWMCSLPFLPPGAIPIFAEVRRKQMFPGTVCRSHFLFLFFNEDKQEKGKGFPGSSDGKESACTAGDLGSIPGSGRSPREGNGLPTAVFLPGESHGQRSLADYSPWGQKDLDAAEQLTISLSLHLICFLTVLSVCLWLFIFWCLILYIHTCSYLGECVY